MRGSKRGGYVLRRFVNVGLNRIGVGMLDPGCFPRHLANDPLEMVGFSFPEHRCCRDVGAEGSDIVDQVALGR